MADNVLGLPDESNPDVLKDFPLDEPDPFPDAPVVDEDPFAGVDNENQAEGLETTEAATVEEPTTEAAPAQEPEAATEAATEEPTTEPAAPVEEASSEAPTSEVPAAETPTEEPRKYAKVFGSVEELEKGYGNALAMHNRTAARNRELEQAVTERDALLQQAAMFIQSQQAPKPESPTPAQADTALIAAAREAGMDDQTLAVLQTIAAGQARAAAVGAGDRVTALEQQIATERAMATQTQLAAAQAQVVSTFFTSHPEIEKGGELDAALFTTLEALDLNPALPEALEIALEATQNPDLLGALLANPTWVDTDAGMTYARQQVALTSGVRSVATTQQSEDAQKARRDANAKAHVENGGVGMAPSPVEEKARDAYDIALEMSKQKPESVLGV